MSVNSDPSTEDVLNLTQEALKLSLAAVHFDKTSNYLGACDYYDKALLNIDEVLNKLPHKSNEWKVLMEIRTKYDDRLEYLREQETAKANNVAIIKRGQSKAAAERKKKRMVFQDESNFSDLSQPSRALEVLPSNVIEIPYWHLRNIKKTIEFGGFLTESVFIPKKVWNQPEVKISGLSAKTTAFQFIMTLISDNIDNLYLSVDDVSLEFACVAFGIIEEALISLQNQLSKPFPYIKEIPSLQPVPIDQIGNNNAINSNGNDGSSVGSISNIQSSPGGNKLTTNRSFSNIVSALGKNVKKYAEVGFQRLVIALPSKLSTEELTEYTTIISAVCSKILDDWYKLLSKEMQSEKNDKSENSKDKLSLETTIISSKAQIAVSNLLNISILLRNILCETLFREIEQLTDQYLLRMRRVIKTVVTLA
eukprot:gene6636-9110_t